MFKTITNSLQGFYRNLGKAYENIKSIPARIRELMEYYLDNLAQVKRKLKDLETTNYNLGWDHLERGNYKDAGLRFWILENLFNKNLRQTQTHLPRIYASILDGNLDKARARLEEVPKEEYVNQTIFYDLDNILNSPQDSLVTLTTGYLQSIRRYCHQVVSESYRENVFLKAADELLESFLDNAEEINDEDKILEVNPACGEIAAGILNKAPPAVRIEGLESDKKLKRNLSELYLYSRKIYNKLHNTTPQEFIKDKAKGSYEYVIFSDEFYVDKELELIKNYSKKALKKGGMLFAILPAAKENDCEVKGDLTGYKFSKKYIEDQLTIENLEILNITESNTDKKYDNYYILGIKRKK